MKRRRLAAAAVLAALCLVSLIPAVSAQERCLSPERVEEIRSALEKGRNGDADPALQTDLLNKSKELSDAIGKYRSRKEGDQKAEAEYQAAVSGKADAVCSLLRTRGWPMRSEIGSDGENALLFLISKSLPIAKQLELYPIVMSGFKSQNIDRGDLLAGYIDRLRVAVGSKQLFGTQVFIRDGFLVMAPIESPGRVDQRRKEFDMLPLASYERFMEVSYRMPLVRSVDEPERAQETEEAGSRKPALPASELQPPFAADKADQPPVVNIETAFVKVDVVIPDAESSDSTSLSRSDFRLFENDKPVDIETFSKADAPFDIVLLLDLSGSTADKIGLIKKTTKRFIEMKRPIDRVSIVTFHDTETVVSELEADQASLLKRTKDIKGSGSSHVWDAVKFGMDLLEKEPGTGRRKAIVLMSDGVDNSLTFYSRLGSKISFADLVEKIQRSDVAIFPIYLDTENSYTGSKDLYETARRTLAYLADQSAGTMYFAKKIDDLRSVYERVLKDLGTVFSLGFTPDVEAGDREWRKLRVEVPSRPGLKLRYRSGYFVR